MHYKPSEGKTIKEHVTIDEQVKSLLTLTPESLLPHHRHLSPSYANRLGNDSSTNKQFWIAEVQAALNDTNSHFHYFFTMTNNRKHRSCSPPPNCLFRQPPTPGPLLSMMRPLFPLPLSGGSPPSVASSPPDEEAHPQTSSSFRPLPPRLQRLTTPPPG